MIHKSQQPGEQAEPSQPFAAPSIELPKGGGAIRDMGEKFAANPVTGTGSLSVPIATSPGRSGFGPQLSLSYDSGAGNGPLGFGWNLSLPAITRKTDKGLPQYLDAEESDVFILSGAEDLVPVYRQDPDGTWVAAHPGYYRDAVGGWVRDGSGNLIIHEDDIEIVHEDDIEVFRVRRYRPRIEGLFARIERWTHIETGDVHWRSLSKDNLLTIYGQDENSRVADPEDGGRIFSWLICETRDDQGNAVVYEYKPEDGTGIDLSQAHERNRGEGDDSRRARNRYLKRIHYGNRTPLLDDAGHRPHTLTPTHRNNAGWMFEVVFDYGEHDLADPKPNDAGDWLARHDPFSSYRAGFEVRTTRLCRRVLMFHHFPDEVGVGQNCLVRSTAFDYQETPVAAFVTAVTQNSYQRADAGGYLRRSLPPLEFEYSQAVIGQDIHDVDPASIENLPVGVDGAAYQWLDLDGEGLSGVLTEQGGGWFYKRNQSALAADRVTPGDSARFSPLEAVARIPRGSPLAQGAQFLDLAGDGQVDLVELDPPMAGFYERTDDQDWESFRPFTSLPNLAWNDPNLKFVDLTGDGHADVLITEDWALTWYPSLAEDGFGPANRVSVPTDEERGPRVVFADGTQTLFLADLSGDGLSDIARIRNGEACYWPNLGYGRFGAKVTMDDAPWFDAPDQFDPRRIRLADLDGSGTTDLIYLGRNQTRLWFNQCGNAWSPAHELSGLPPVDNVASIAAVDLLGNGTACLVWSSPLPADSRAPMKYLKLMAEGKPHLLIGTRNNLGAETRVHYAPSTYFYLRDQEEGTPWLTKLPFPVHVVERVETLDHISRNRFVTRYAYHHGYFD
ncbi:MAG: toxin, partial [Candidatus Competibacteraceae bacterium]